MVTGGKTTTESPLSVLLAAVSVVFLHRRLHGRGRRRRRRHRPLLPAAVVIDDTTFDGNNNAQTSSHLSTCKQCSLSNNDGHEQQ